MYEDGELSPEYMEIHQKHFDSAADAGEHARYIPHSLSQVRYPIGKAHLCLQLLYVIFTIQHVPTMYVGELFT